MSLFDSASLIVTPNGYKEDKLYSIKPSDGSGDLVVTRATTATRVNSDGLIEVTPYNLLTYSQDFTNAIWTKQNSIAVTANTTTAPNGTTTADTLEKASGSGGSNFYYIVTSTNSFEQLTNFFYVKHKSGSGIVWLLGKNSGSFAFFDVINGTALSKSSGMTTSVESVGNGWYKCIFSQSYVGASSTEFGIGLCLADGTPNYDATSAATQSVYIWGAQAVTGTSAKDYFPTTDRLDVPRLDYTNSSCPSILVEPQRTNLLLRSEEFDNAYWQKTNMVIVANDTTAPDGTNTADRATASFYPSTSIVRTNLLTAASHTLSVYVKSGSVSTFRLGQVTGGYGLGSTCIFNLSTLSTTITNYGGTTGSTATITNVGNGWYRCTLTVLTTAATYFSELLPAANGSVFIWGAQLEVGSNATSYVPTVASSVTRNADVISKTGISSLIGQTEGTIFIDFNINDLQIQTIDPVIFSTSGTNYIRLFTTGVISYFESNTVSIVSASNVINNGRNKIAVNYKNNDFSLYVNGVLVGSNNSGSVVAKSNFALRYLPNALFDPKLFYNSIVFFPTKLNGAESINLTTI